MNAGFLGLIIGLLLIIGVAFFAYSESHSVAEYPEVEARPVTLFTPTPVAAD